MGKPMTDEELTALVEEASSFTNHKGLDYHPGWETHERLAEMAPSLATELLALRKEVAALRARAGR